MKRISLLLFALLFFLMHCSNPNDNADTEILIGEEEPMIELPADILQGMYPPYDVDRNAPALEQALFAWKEMIALSWKSTYTPESPERGQPDKDYSISQGTPTDPLVWETFAHRVEYRPKGDVITKDFNSKPAYDFVLEKEEVSEGEGGQKDTTIIEGTINWNGIDPSQHFVLLDEDNEIGSCYVFADAQDGEVTPANELVMYMAKVNQVEYDFRKQHFNSHELMKEALQNIKADKTAPTDFDKLIEISNYQSEDKSDPCGSAHFAGQKLLSLPCSDAENKVRGVIEIKTAWRPLTEADNPDEFLVREAVIFEEPEENMFSAKLEKYVLLGIHIIHKTNNFRHFFIATWEHNSLEEYGYNYVVIPDALPFDHQRERGKVLPVERNKGAGMNSKDDFTYSQVSDAIQAAVKAQNPKHFLANYRLTGYQSDVFANESLADRKNKMPSYYLANLVVESDDALSKFSGSSQKRPFNDSTNIVANGFAITTGGCSGCHGVAQLKGADVSFLNDVFEKPIPFPEVTRLSEETIKTLELLSEERSQN